MNGGGEEMSKMSCGGEVGWRGERKIDDDNGEHPELSTTGKRHGRFQISQATDSPRLRRTSTHAALLLVFVAVAGVVIVG